MKKMFCCLILIMLCFCLLQQNILAESNGFLKKGFYAKNVLIPNPENNVLAETFLINGINVVTKREGYRNDFSFKTTSNEENITILIYYGHFWEEPKYVGKFIYKKSDANLTTYEKTFVKEFVAWMLKNAWDNKDNK